MTIIQVLIIIFMFLSLTLVLINHHRMNKMDDINIQLWYRVLKLTGELDVDEE